MPIVALADGVWAGLAASGVLTLVGLAAIGIGLTSIRRERAIARWPRAPGTVVSSTYSREDHLERRPDGDLASTTLTPVVRYNYSVAGQRFTGQSVSRSPLRTSDADAVKRVIDRYPEGAKVEVLVDPADPRVAYLETRTSGGAIFFLIFGGFLATMGAGGLAMVSLSS